MHCRRQLAADCKVPAGGIHPVNFSACVFGLEVALDGPRRDTFETGHTSTLLPGAAIAKLMTDMAKQCPCRSSRADGTKSGGAACAWSRSPNMRYLGSGAKVKVGSPDGQFPEGKPCGIAGRVSMKSCTSARLDLQGLAHDVADRELSMSFVGYRWRQKPRACRKNSRGARGSRLRPAIAAGVSGRLRPAQAWLHSRLRSAYLWGREPNRRGPRAPLEGAGATDRRTAGNDVLLSDEFTVKSGRCQGILRKRH